MFVVFILFQVRIVNEVSFWFHRDQKLLDLLYEEARYNILEGRYPCEVAYYIMLGGIQARIELGPYNPQVHTIQFFRYSQLYLCAYMRRLTSCSDHPAVLQHTIWYF
jgi:FERM central domain.